MDMSYKHAWDLVESMNRQFLKPLVVGSVGGKGGGGSKLTGAGEKAVDSFRELYNRLRDFLEKETQRLAP
jgi:molybdate transport system regulatory protein